MRKSFLGALMAALVVGLGLDVHPGWAQEQDLPPVPVPIQPGGSRPVAPPPPAASIPPPPPYGPPAPPPPPLVAPVYEPLNLWFSADYLLWWTRNDRVPALVTAGVAANAGVLGPAGTTQLFPGGEEDSGVRSGGRFTLGFWFQDTRGAGMELGYFFLGNHSAEVAAGTEEANVAGAAPGTFFVTQSSTLQGAEVNAVANLADGGGFRLDFLGGFRYLQLDEALRIEQDFVWPDLSELDTWDDAFHTHNRFYGGQVGARAEWMLQRLFVNATGKVALGVTQERVSIGGGLTQAVVSDGFQPLAVPVTGVQVIHSPIGGLLADPASFRRNRFAVVPEVGLNLGYQLTSCLRLSTGYSFLYWSSVARPGDQVTGASRTTSYWAQGVTFNLGLNF